MSGVSIRYREGGAGEGGKWKVQGAETELRGVEVEGNFVGMG